MHLLIENISGYTRRRLFKSPLVLQYSIYIIYKAFCTTIPPSLVEVDYDETVAPIMVTLSENNTRGCTDVSIIEDMLVEGQEDFEVSINVRAFYGSFTLEGSNFTKITILDSNSEKHILMP